MIKKLKKNFSTLLMIFAMLFTYFAPITNVFANATTTTLTIVFREGHNANGKVQYSLNDGASWIDVTDNIQNQNITVTGDNLRLKIVPNEGKNIDFTGIELDLDGVRVENLGETTIGSTGYSVPGTVEAVVLNNIEFGGAAFTGNETATVSLQMSGSELEYNMPWSDAACDFAFAINDGQERRFTQDEVTYTMEGEDIIGLTRGDFEYSYNYDAGPVTFSVRTQWNDIYTSFKINNVLYSTPQTREQLINAYNGGGMAFTIEDVPYATRYDIEIVGRKQNESEIIMGNFGWTYDPNTNEFSDDDKIPHGNLEFVQAVYNSVTYTTPDEVNAQGGVFKWKSANKTDDPFGEATFPPGTVLTMRLVPDPGYQLVSLDLNGFPFEPGEEVGLYTFTIGGGNWHLGATFVEVGNEVQANSANIKSGNLVLDSNIAGTSKLEVNDVENLEEERVNEFTTTATQEGYNLENILDISLFNQVFKAGLKDADGNYESWDTPIENTDNKATISLELEDNMSGKDLAVIHETHEGAEVTGYELIPATYDESTNTVTFEADSFSNYAIVTRAAGNPKTSDSVYRQIILLIISLFGLTYGAVSISKRKQYN